MFFYSIKVLMLHPSRIFVLYLSLFLVSVCYFIFHPIFIDKIYLIPILIILLAFWRIKFIRYVYLLLFVILLACIRTFPYAQSPDLNIYKDKLISGYISSEPYIVDSKQKFTLTLTGSHPVKPKIEIATNQSPKYKFGDEIKIDGKLSNEYLNSSHKSKNIFARMSYPDIKVTGESKLLYIGVEKYLLKIKNFFKDRISMILPEPHSGLVNGILLGERSNISDSLKTSLSRTGTTHIIALSGFNITIVAIFLGFLTSGLSRKSSVIISIIGIFCFVCATGFSSSAIRAGIMGTLLVLSKIFGRKSDGIIAIIFACVVMTFLNPMILLYDIGFQLSFSAACGIIFFYPKIEHYFNIFGKTMSQNIAATISAILFTWPITSYYFEVFSLVALFTNILILPFIEWLMFFGFISVFISYISKGLTDIFIYICWGMSSYIFKVIETFSKINWAVLDLKINSWIFLIGYFLVVFEIIYILGNIKYAKTKNI